MVKRAFPFLLIVSLLLAGCKTIQSWLPGGDVNPTGGSTMQTPPMPGSSGQPGNETTLQGETTAIPLPKELTTTATAIAADSITQLASDVAEVDATYKLQEGTPMAVANFSQPEKGCNWMGVGGQVFNARSEPVLFLVVEVGGTLNGAAVSALALTGSATSWGPGGYEIKLSDQVIESSGTVWVQFFDLGGTPVSEKVYLTTYLDCSKNAIMVNMVQPKAPGIKIYMPVINSNTNTTP